MKKILFVALAAFFVLALVASAALAFEQGAAQEPAGSTAQSSSVDSNDDGVCENCGQPAAGQGNQFGRLDADDDLNDDASIPGTGNRYGNGPGQGTGFVDEDGDGVCDNCNSGQGMGFVDEDGDGVCDNCGSGQGGSGYGRGPGQGMGFVDEDSDGVCDNCGSGQGGSGYGRGPGQGMGFVDEDGDGVCDNCGSGQGPAFVDADGDGVCDHAGIGGQGQGGGNGRGSGKGGNGRGNGGGNGGN